MRVIIAGGTGFLGRALSQSLAADGHEVCLLTRGSGGRAFKTVSWTPNGASGPWASAIDGADAVVNLAGESIAAKRWSAAQKQRILDSRVQATRSLVVAIRAPQSTACVRQRIGGRILRSARRRVATEDTPPGSDFLAGVCVTWESEARRAVTPRTRVACIRTGLVLARDGGALPPMLPPFRFGAGGPVGSGRQYRPWIHRQDWVDLVRWAMRTPDSGMAINATAPNPVTNAEFARALGRAMHRPAFMPAPAFALRLLLGEMADALLLSGQRAVPREPNAAVSLHLPKLDDALHAIFVEAQSRRTQSSFYELSNS